MTQGTPAFADHFSATAGAYRAFRPTYPDRLFGRISAACSRRELAWECGAGSGQATGGLVAHFRRVVATDASLAQLSGLRVPGASPVACLAEAAPLADGCVDLVAVAQALHWFRLDAFYAEVERVARPGAVVAAWTYSFPTVGPDVDPVLLRFASEEVGPWWPEERRHVDDGYRTLPFPFEARAVEEFETVRSLTSAEVLGWIGTWSAVRRAREALGRDPLEGLREAWREAWPTDGSRRTVRWPVRLLLGRAGKP